MAGEDGGGDAGRFHLQRHDSEQHCSKHGHGGCGTVTPCGKGSEHRGVHRLAAVGLQHEDRHGGKRHQPRATATVVDSPGGVQESGVPVL